MSTVSTFLGRVELGCFNPDVSSVNLDLSGVLR